MDISGWPIEKILQLPESAFGKREIIQLYGRGTPPARPKDISRATLPDHTIIWEISIQIVDSSGSVGHIGLRLGKKLPASDAEFDAMEPIFLDVVDEAGIASSFMAKDKEVYSLRNVRKYVEAQGRKLVCEIGIHTGGVFEVVCQIIYSSIPKEVPDFYAGHPMEQWNELIRLMRIGVTIG